jgi:hypothetical protein
LLKWTRALLLPVLGQMRQKSSKVHQKQEQVLGKKEILGSLPSTPMKMSILNEMKNPTKNEDHLKLVPEEIITIIVKKTDMRKITPGKGITQENREGLTTESEIMKAVLQEGDSTTTTEDQLRMAVVIVLLAKRGLLYHSQLLHLTLLLSEIFLSMLSKKIFIDSSRKIAR